MKTTDSMPPDDSTDIMPQGDSAPDMSHVDELLAELSPEEQSYAMDKLQSMCDATAGNLSEEDQYDKSVGLKKPMNTAKPSSDAFTP